MNSQQISFFLSAAEHLSFTRAAEAHYTTQPTVSRQISALEEELGFPLFYREGRQLRLTSGGLVMLGEFTQQQNSLDHAVRRATRMSSGFEGSLNIGFLSSFDTDSYVYPPSMLFSSKYPGVTLNLDGASFNPLRQRLYAKEYDVIFTYDFELPYFEGCLSQLVYRTGCSLVSSSHHPLAAKERLTAQDLRESTLILPYSGHMEGWSVNIFEMLSREYGLTSEDYSHISVRCVDTLDTKQFLVRAGAGLGITGNCASYAYDNRYALHPIHSQTLEIHAVWQRDNHNPAIPLYLQVLSHAAEIDVFRPAT